MIILCAMRLTISLIVFFSALLRERPRVGFRRSRPSRRRRIHRLAAAPSAAAQLRTTLYFGTTRPTGAVSELEWQMFLRDEVTQRFPDGLTVWDAQGQWKAPKGTIDQERLEGPARSCIPIRRRRARPFRM